MPQPYPDKYSAASQGLLQGVQAGSMIGQIVNQGERNRIYDKRYSESLDYQKKRDDEDRLFKIITHSEKIENPDERLKYLQHLSEKFNDNAELSALVYSLSQKDESGANVHKAWDMVKKGDTPGAMELLKRLGYKPDDQEKIIAGALKEKETDSARNVAAGQLDMPTYTKVPEQTISAVRETPQAGLLDNVAPFTKDDINTKTELMPPTSLDVPDTAEKFTQGLLASKYSFAGNPLQGIDKPATIPAHSLLNPMSDIQRKNQNFISSAGQKELDVFNARLKGEKEGKEFAPSLDSEYVPIGDGKYQLKTINRSTGKAIPILDENGKPIIKTHKELLESRGGKTESVTDPYQSSYNRELGKGTAKKEIAKEISYPKVKGKIVSLNQQWDNVANMIDKAIKDVSHFSAGIGAWTKVLPATPARNLQNTLASIQANIGFDKLSQMREDSPTGGALGQVSDFENKLLQAVQGSLEQEQSVPQLIDNLKNAKRLLLETKQNRNDAFNYDYREFINKDTPNRRAGDKPNTLATITSDADFNALPSGTEFIAPDGTKRRKP